MSSTDGFCSVIKFKPDEIGTVYTAAEAEDDLENTTSQDESIIEEAMDEDEDDEDVPVSKEGIPLNKEGVCSPADIKIKSVKEGGRPNPRRLQLITISSPKSKSETIDENDLNLILEETVAEPTAASTSSNNDDKNNQKKRVPFVTLSTSGTS